VASFIRIGLVTIALFLVTAPTAAAAPFDSVSGFSISPPDSGTQTGKLQHGAPSACSPAKTAPAVDPGSFNYDGLFEQSAINEPACVTVEVTSSDPACWSNGLFSASYLGDFDDTDVRANYLGDIGSPVSDPTTASYSFVVPGGQTFATLFHMSVSGTGCSSFDASWSSDRPWTSIPPRIIGHPFVGQTLASSSGVWSAGALTFQWRRCALDGTACTAIPGATGPSYLVTANDVGHALSLRVTATDGSVASTSDSPPTIAGIEFGPTGAQSLTGSDSTQKGRLAFNPVPSTCASPRSATPSAVDTPGTRFYDVYSRSNQSESPLCTIASLDASCTGSGGATSAAYLPAFEPATSVRTNYLADGGVGAISGARTVNYSFTVPPGASYDVAVSTLNAGVTCDFYLLRLGATAPYPLVSPTVQNEPIEGHTLRATFGSWTGAPAFAYQWRQCLSDGSGCVDVPGATGDSYQLTSFSVGHTYRVRVTASEGAGSASKSSAATPVVAAKPYAGIPLLPATVKVKPNGVVNLRLECPGTAVLACSGTDTLRLGKRKLGSKSFLIFTGRTANLRVTLSKRDRKLLAKRKTLKVTQFVSSRDARRAWVPTRAPLTLKARKR
jgi:hypothetical protein